MSNGRPNDDQSALVYLLAGWHPERERWANYFLQGCGDGGPDRRRGEAVRGRGSDGGGGPFTGHGVPALRRRRAHLDVHAAAVRRGDPRPRRALAFSYVFAADDRPGADAAAVVRLPRPPRSDDGCGR